MKRFAVLLLALLLCGCGAQPVQPTEAVPATRPPETEGPTEPVILETMDVAVEAEAILELPPEPVSVVLMPEAPGTLEQRCEEAVIDYSNAADGYVMAQYFGETDSRLKVVVQGPTTTYAYNLPVGQWEVFPLSDGNGSYSVNICINVTGNKYALVSAVSFEVELTDEFAPFLRPNQYVNYTAAPNTVQLGAELTVGMEHPLEKVAAVYDHVVHSLTYDEEKAATVKSGYLPELDRVLEEQKGICFDYAALMTAMLRSQEVPCKLVVGYAGEVYHAWISVWTEEDGWIDGAIFFDGHVWKRMDPTFASSGGETPEIMDFIEHGEYRVKYLY